MMQMSGRKSGSLEGKPEQPMFCDHGPAKPGLFLFLKSAGTYNRSNMTEDSFSHDRHRMVEDQLVRRNIRDQRVLAAMRTIPRHLFVPDDQRHLAYIDAPLSIGSGQTISQPYIVALMTELLELEQSESVLEIGTGSGYQAAILSQLARHVYSIERIPALAGRAEAVIMGLGIDNVHIVGGDGTQGLEAYAPYHGIIVTAAAPRVPEPLEGQIAPGGRLVLPVGSRGGQILEVWRRRDEKLVCEKVAPVAFVPLIGENGWPEEGDSSRWWRW
jgi:protein-L-isoaspartate(D-aspartate) O-methyltransferase